MRLSIQRRLMLAFLGLAVVPLLLAAFTNAVLYYRQHTNDESKHLQELSLRVAMQVDGALRQGERALDNLQLYRDLPRLARSEQETLLAELLARHDFLQEAALLDGRGHEVARRSAVEAVLGGDLRDRHADPAFRIPFASGETWYGPIHYDASGEPLLAVSLPLRNLHTGKAVAVMIAELRLKALWDLVAEVDPGAGTQVYVLDEQGVVVAHRNPSVVLRETRAEILHGATLGKGLAKNRAFVADSLVQVGQRAFRIVAEHDWSHAMGPALNNLVMLAGVLLLALAVAVGAGMHVLRRIVRPIMNVEKTARAIATGDLTQRVAVTSQDEIGDLAESFNAMTGNLQHTLNELQAEVKVRLQAEQLLRASETYLQQLLYNLPAAVMVHGPEGAIQYGNPAAVEFLGLTADQAQGKAPYVPHFIAEDGSPMPARDIPVNRVIAEGRPLNNYMVGVVLAEGAATRWAYVDAFPDIDERGALRQVIVSFVDITERKQAEAELVRHREHLEVLVAERTTALRESETRYRTVANFTNDWETWRGEDGNYRYISPSCERVTGYRAEEFAADPGLLLRIIHDEDRDRFAQHLQLSSEHRQRDTLEFRLTRRDGQLIWIEHICQPVHDESGAYLGARASNRDVTDHKQQALELARARDQAEAANRAKSVFLANMSHELRTPMNAILGFAQLMQKDPTMNEHQRAHVERISRSGHHLLTLINDVLEISKIEAGKITLQPRAFDLVELLDSIEETIELRSEKKGLALGLELAPEVPHYVNGDDKKLRQVLVNLLSNAVKFTTSGSIRVRVAMDPDTQRAILFEVIDTGCGIAPEEKTKIFDAFYQTADSVRRGEGTGLGLTISREYVELMGGQLTAESELGKGSTFRFAIPLEVVPAIETKRHGSGRRVTGIAADQPRYRILIAEDRPDNRVLMQELLESVGFDVRVAENGERALNLFHCWRPHLIWMDMRMPVMDGYEATRRIKAAPAGRETVVLALTASAFEEDRADVLAAGCDGFLRKPLNVDEVFEAMAEHLGVRYTYADQAPSSETAPVISLDRNALAAAPEELRAELARVALLLDAQQTHAVIARLGEGAPELAAALDRMVDDYRFDDLYRLCQEPISA